MNTSNEHPLPELDDARVAAMERTVFARIADERSARTTRRRRWWVSGAAAAAVVVVAAVIAPVVTGTMATSTSFSAEEVRLLPAQPLDEAVPGVVDGAVGGAPAVSAEQDSMMDASRQTISTGSATIVVDDVATTAQAISRAMEARGGYVESVSVGSSDPAIGYRDGVSLPGPNSPGAGWMTVRVPADDLTNVVGSLAEFGEVTSSTLSAQDVTDQAVDLRARIAAAETSVQRLTQLMAEAQSTADLIAAESALQERQATLDSDRQQLKLLEGQVSMASLSIQLVPVATPVDADPAGFGDGVAAGWNGLVATLNGVVIAIGFLLPWIVVLGAAGLVVWVIVAVTRRSRGRRRVSDREEG